MNKLFFVLSLLLTNNLDAKQCYNKKSYIQHHYLNGMNVNKTEYLDSIELLEIKFNLKDKIEKLYNPTIYDGIFGKEAEKLEVKMDNNPNESSFKNKSRLGMIKSMHEIGIASTVVNDTFNEVIPQKIVELKTLVLLKKNSSKYDLLEELSKSPSKQLVSQFKTKLNQDKPNIIFAHSQGNLVVNELCLQRDNADLEIISIASPGGHLPCNSNKTYVLYEADKVINALKKLKNIAGSENVPLTKLVISHTNLAKLDFITPNLSSPTYPSNSFIKMDERNHSLDTYLNDPIAFEKLQTGLNKTKEDIYEKNLNKEFIKITLDYKKEDFESKEKPKFTKEQLKNIELLYKIALLKNTKIRPFTWKNGGNYVGNRWSDIIDTPFPTNNFDVHSAFLKISHPYTSLKECYDFRHNTTLPYFHEVCKDRRKDNNSRNISSESVSPQLSLTLDKQEKPLTIMCKDVINGQMQLKLNYLSNIKNDQIVTVNINNVSYEITIPQTKSLDQYLSEIGILNISSANDYYTFDALIEKSPKNVSKTKPVQTFKTDPESSKCNTYRKLFSPACSGYLSRL